MNQYTDFRGKTIKLFDIVAYAGRGKSRSWGTHDNRGAAVMRVAQVSNLKNGHVQITFPPVEGQRLVRILVKDLRKIAAL